MTNVIMIVALTIFGEASGEKFPGKHGVASVIWRRSNGHVSRFEQVCQAPRQFSCWGPGDIGPVVPHDAPSKRAWAECRMLAAAMCSPDRTAFLPNIVATHFCTLGVHPSWAREMVLVAVIGGHKFFDDGCDMAGKESGL